MSDSTKVFDWLQSCDANLNNLDGFAFGHNLHQYNSRYHFCDTEYTYAYTSSIPYYQFHISLHLYKLCMQSFIRISNAIHTGVFACLMLVLNRCLGGIDYIAKSTKLYYCNQKTFLTMCDCDDLKQE